MRYRFFCVSFAFFRCLVIFFCYVFISPVSCARLGDKKTVPEGRRRGEAQACLAWGGRGPRNRFLALHRLLLPSSSTTTEPNPDSPALTIPSPRPIFTLLRIRQQVFLRSTSSKGTGIGPNRRDVRQLAHPISTSSSPAAEWTPRKSFEDQGLGREQIWKRLSSLVSTYGRKKLAIAGRRRGREGGKEFLSSLAKANTPFPPSFCVFPPSPAVLARSNAMVGGKVGV